MFLLCTIVNNVVKNLPDMATKFLADPEMFVVDICTSFFQTFDIRPSRQECVGKKADSFLVMEIFNSYIVFTVING